MAIRSFLAWATLAWSAVADNDLLPKIVSAMTGAAYLPESNIMRPELSDAVRKAQAVINKSIRTGESLYGPIDNQETSFSISVFSAQSNETNFDLHFEAPQLSGSCTKGRLTDDTIYRTGSLGKLMTVYAILVEIGDHVFLDPVTTYIVSFNASLCK
jgi:hypothetical protein